MSSREDREWNKGPVYRPTFRTPTFVKEVGLAQQNELRPTTLPDQETLDRGERVRNIYQSLAATWSSDVKKDPEVIDLFDQDDDDDDDDHHNGNDNDNDNDNSSDVEIQFVKSVRSRPLPVTKTSSSAIPSSVAKTAIAGVTSTSINASNTATKSTTSIATINRPNVRAPSSQWFIRHALATTTPTNQFSLTAPSSTSAEPAQRASLASLIDLSEPGNGPAFVPPPHFHIKPGNKGYDMLKTLGWSGRGLGKAEAEAGTSATSVSVDITHTEKRAPATGQDPDSSKPNKKKARHTIPQTFSDASSSSSDESTFDALPSPPRLASSSVNVPSSGTVSPSSRRTLIAPISTTLKSDLLGIRPSGSSGGHHRAITHTARSIKLANRDSALAEGRMGPKATRRKVERERKERLALMAELNR